MTNQEVYQWIYYACDSTGHPELRYKIFWNWNNRFTDKAGDAKITSSGTGRIRLGSKVLALADEQTVIDTIVHETCHIIDLFINGRDNSGTDGHGPKWQELMKRCGVVPERYHCINTDCLRKRFEASCACKTHKITANSLTKMKRGVKYRCLLCKTFLRCTQLSNEKTT
jgi:predicted SprT family Zn-dependent metalloprotease